MTPVDKQLTPPGGWHKADGPKIQPLSAEKASWPVKALLWGAGKFSQGKTGSDQVPDVFLLLMNHQHLFWQWLQFASRLMPFGTLDRRDAELVILRVGWNCRCRYEWGQHVTIGMKEGLTAEEVARVAKGPADPGWTPRRSALLQAADEINKNRMVSSETYARLAEHYDGGKLIEVLLLIGSYEMLAGVINSVGLDLEPDTEALLAESGI